MPHLALWIDKDAHQRVASIEEYYAPGPDEVLVRNVVAAVNRSDFAHAEIFGHCNTVYGSDAVGIVYQVGTNVSNLKKGDKILVFCPLGDHRYGCHQEYFLAAADVAWPIPSGLSDSQAATIPTAFLAAADGLLNIFGLSLSGISSRQSILIWGGASGVGIYAIQLAKAIGCHPILTTASTKHHNYLHSLGADYCFDYREDNLINNITSIHPSKLTLAFDAICLEGSAAKCSSLLSPDGRLATIAPTMQGQCVFSARIHSRKQVLGAGLRRPLLTNDATFAAERANMHAAMRWALTNIGRGFQPIPVSYLPHGLHSITDAIDSIRKGTISAEKCIYKFDDTNY